GNGYSFVAVSEKGLAHWPETRTAYSPRQPGKELSHAASFHHRSDPTARRRGAATGSPRHRAPPPDCDSGATGTASARRRSSTRGRRDRSRSGRYGRMIWAHASAIAETLSG